MNSLGQGLALGTWVHSWLLAGASIYCHHPLVMYCTALSTVGLLVN